MAGQLSFFSAAALPPEPGDLAGLLCGPAQLVSRPGKARISVVLAEPWRVDALLAELDRRGLGAEVRAAGAEDGWSGGTAAARSVRTGFDPALSGLAACWGGSGAGKRAPAGFVLDGPMLRLWYVIAGRRWEGWHSLGVGGNDEHSWAAIGAALARAGLPAAFVGPRGDGPAYRITGRRRLDRLAELVGDPPTGWPAADWPG